MKKIKTAFAGLGRIGWQFHLPTAAAHEGFEPVAACDALPERLEEARAKYGVAGYSDFRQMIYEVKPELAVVATPTPFHTEHAIYAMENGCDVFLDKPMARDLAEAKTIADARGRTGRKLMVYQPHRVTAETQALLRLLKSGVLGDIYMIRSARRNFVFRSDWQAFKKFGGGMLNNYGAHAIDMMLFLTGSKAKRVDGFMHRIAAAGDAEDVVKLLIETERGTTLDIDINMASALDLAPLIVYGRYGTAMLVEEKERQYYRVRYFDPADQAVVVASEHLAAIGRLYVTTEPANWRETDFNIEPGDAINFYDKCYAYYALGEAPFVPLEDTLEVMRVIKECRATAGW